MAWRSCAEGRPRQTEDRCSAVEGFRRFYSSPIVGASCEARLIEPGVRKGRIAALLIFAISSTATAYADAAISAASPKVVTVLEHRSVGSSEFEAVHMAAEAFNREQSVYRVELSPTISLHFDDRVQDAAAAGALPCVVEFDGPYLYSFAWAGYLQPLDRFAPRSLRRDVLPSIIAQGTYDGRLYSLGQFDSGLGLWGNRRYLRAAGVRIPTVASPWSLAEFEQALKKLSTVRGVKYPLELNVYDSTATEFYAYAYAPILKGFGGGILSHGPHPSAQGALNGPQSIAAMDRFQSWFKKGWAASDLHGVDSFYAGEAALSWNGHWRYADYRRALGSDLTLLPLPDFGTGVKTGMGSWAWGISSTCREPEGAWKFLAHLMSAREILRMTQANGGVPARRSVLAQSQLYGLGGALHVFAQQLDAGYGAPRPPSPNYNLVSRTFSSAVRAIVRGGDVKRELDKAAGIIDNDIAAHNGYPVE